MMDAQIDQVIAYLRRLGESAQKNAEHEAKIAEVCKLAKDAKAAVSTITSHGRGVANGLELASATLTGAAPELIPEPIETPPAPPPAPPEEKPTPTPEPLPGAGFTLVSQNMTEIKPGVWRSTDLDRDQKCGLQARLKVAVKNGQTSRFSYKQTTNVIPDGKLNLKTERDWPTADGGYPNNYHGRQIKSGQHCFTVETVDSKVAYLKSSPNAWTVGYFDYPVKPNVEHTVVQEIRYSTAAGKPDGHVKITFDGKTVLDAGGLICPGPRKDFGVQMVNANPGTSGRLPAGSYLQAEILGLEVLK